MLTARSERDSTGTSEIDPSTSSPLKKDPIAVEATRN